jgi:hypothetical protein
MPMAVTIAGAVALAVVAAAATRVRVTDAASALNTV